MPAWEGFWFHIHVDKSLNSFCSFYILYNLFHFKTRVFFTICFRNSTLLTFPYIVLYVLHVCDASICIYIYSTYDRSNKGISWLFQKSMTIIKQDIQILKIKHKSIMYFQSSLITSSKFIWDAFYSPSSVPFHIMLF